MFSDEISTFAVQMLIIQSKKTFYMIIIQIKDNESIEKALRRYKRKVQDTNLHKQVRQRQFF